MDAVAVESVLNALVECGVDREKASQVIAKLEKDGELFRPSYGLIALTKRGN